jgi:autotransporter-associated beta strand protein
VKPQFLSAHRVSRATLLATSLGLAIAGHAAETTITKADNTDALNLGSSWSGGTAPGASDVALWDSTVTGANTTLLGGDLSWAGIRIADPGGAVSIGAGNTLTLGSVGIDMSAASKNLTLANALALGAAQTWNVSVGQSLTVTGALSGSGGIAKSGPGTLLLGGANTSYSGTVTINEGAVELNNGAALGTANAITLGASGGSADPTLTIGVSGVTHTLGAITVPTTVTGARISLPQNTGTRSHTIAGATLASPLTVAQSNASGSNWSQVTWTSKITGNGGGSGNDTLVFHNTGSSQNYYTTNAGVIHDFSGNIHLKGGLIAVQSGTPSGNLTIPDSSLLWLEAGEWRWNNGGMAETIDGLRGAGVIGNPQNLTLTINANNSANDANRSFSGTLGNMAGALTLGGTGTQEFSGNKVTYTNATNLNNGTLKLTNTTAWSSSIAMGASNSPKVQLNAPVAADAWTFGKVMSGANTSASVEKTGAGTVTVATSQTYSGATTVSVGTLKIQSTDYPTAMPTIPGMRVWLDAADPEADGNTTVPTPGAGVSTWKNKGTMGATADFTASAAGTNPPTYTSSVGAFNNKPTITFNAATGKMLANTVNYGNTVSVVYVGRIGATKARLVSGGTQNWILGYHGGNMNTNYWGSTSTGSGAADTNPHIWISGATSGSNILGYRFDGAGETALPTGTGSVAPTAGLTLGGGWNVTTTPTEKSDGDIAELFVFDHQLTTTERTQLEGYLYNKYYGSQYPAVLAGLNPTGPVNVANGTSFGGYGTAGNTTVAAGGTILAGNSGLGSLTLNSLAFSGASSVTGTPATTAAPLVVTGALASGGNSVSLVVPPTLAVGTHHMIQYGSLSGSLGDFKFPAPIRTMAIANNAPYIDVVVSASSSYPVWTGTGSGEWSYNTGLGNWKLSTDSSATDFMAQDAVLFDDTVGAGNTAISVGVSNISAGVITFNNSSKNYSLTQANGMDINAGSLVKTGSGTLTISGSFTFPGGASLNGGLVSVDSVGSLGTGSRSFDGGALEYTGATGTMAGTTTLNAGGAAISVTNAETTLSFGGALGGSGPLVKTGAGSLITPLATGTYANAIQINEGTLGLNYGANAVILSGPISGSGGVLRLDGTGASATTGLTLTGSNTFTGETHIYGRRIFLDRTGGNAINGDVVFKQANWPYHDLSLNQNEQIIDTALLRWEQAAGQDVYEFRLNGKTETVAGLISSATSPAIIENAGYDGGNDNNIPAGKLIVNTPVGADYSYTGALRNQNGGTDNGALSFEKAGPGTQTLIGGFVYTGTTTVSGGKLVLQDASAPFASSGVTLAAGTTLEFKRTSGSGSTAAPISGAGTVSKSGVGTTTLTGNQTYTGITSIEDGTLSITGSLASPVIDVQQFGALGTTTVGTGTTVKGTGTLVGVTFGGGATLTPGTASTIETMFGDGTITFLSGSTCAMNADRTGGSITSDRLEGMDAIVYGGTLTVTATGQSFLSGDVVSLFPGAGTYGGGFTITNLPFLSGGLSWDLSNLTVDGSIKVVSSVPTPVFNPPAGGYIGAQTVSISSASGSTIYYTLDGSTPTTSSPNGPSPITGITIPTNSDVTLKAFAKKIGQADSPVTTSIYHTLDLPVWTFDGTGSWQDAANWQGGVLAQGTGVTADFSTLATSASNEVWLDGPRTVGQLIFGDQGNQFEWTLSAGNGGSLTLNNGANPPVVNVLNQTATISAAITSSNGLRKTGPGNLKLAEANSISGPVTIEGGTLNLGNSSALANGTAITLGTTGASNPTLAFGFAGDKTVGALTIPAGVTGATFSLPQNTSTFSHTIAGATLGSPLKVAQSNAASPNWSQVTWSSKLTGTGAGSGNDTLVFENTSAMQNYFTMAAGVANDFVGNVRVKGFVAAQSGSAGGNLMIPDASMLIIESGQWRWNQGGFVETIDGLAGAGTMSNTANVTLTIDASNADNHGDRVFTGSLGTLGGTLLKKGSGTQTFSGTAINYTNATTVDAGTLELNGTTSFASSAVTVNGGKLLVNNTTGSGTGTTATIAIKTGTTLAGTGTVSGTTTIEAGGTVAPGDATAGALGANNLSLAGTYQCQLDTATGDALTVTGTLTMQPGAAINVSTLGTPTAPSYTILTYGTLSGALPAITGVPAGYSVDTSTTGQVKLVSGTPFDSWINGFASLTNPADKTATADPDKDGLANVVEFVLNGNPANGAITNLPTITTSGANLVFTYLRRDDSESLNQAVEFDADLAGTWTTAVNGSNGVTIAVTENGSDPDTVTVTIPKQTNAKLFARLKVNP